MSRDKYGYGKTGYDSHRHDPPWIQTTPEPDIACPDENCGWFAATETYLNNHDRVPEGCPECGKEVEEI